MILTERFLHYIQSHHLHEPGQQTLLAVSGGMDSMAMLSLYLECHFQVAIAHCNFRLRGEESEADARFVGETAQSCGLPFFLKEFDTMGYARKHKLSIQMAARELRYQWFGELHRDGKFTKVATAHHLDDQIETFFINLLRGTGIKGLKGMEPSTEYLIKPLLAFTRQEIFEYAQDKKIRFRNDTSNDGDYYLRNQIRHLVIPVLRDIQQSLYPVMLRNMQRISDESRLLSETLKQKAIQLTLDDKEPVTLSIQVLLAEPQRDLVLTSILEPLGFHQDQIKQIVENLQDQSGKRFASKTHRLVKDRDTLLITQKKSGMPHKAVILKDRGDHFTFSSRIYGTKLTIQKGKVDSQFYINPDPRKAFLDLDRVKFPLTLRRWDKGDRFTPLGMSGKKKLSDFLTDLRLSIFQKEETLVLCQGEKIIWVVGHRISHYFRIRPSTQNYCLISLSGI